MRLRVADTETTGLTRSHRVIECAYTDVVLVSENVNVWQTSVRDRSFFNPDGQKCDIGALCTHHITPDMYATAPSHTKVSKFLHWCDALPGQSACPDALVFHNAKYDMQYIQSDLPVICTLNCARKVWPNAGKHNNQYLRYFLNLDLDPAMCDPPHRALPDTWVTAHILMALLAEHKVDQLVEWSGLDLQPALPTTIPWGEHQGKLFREIPSSYLSWVFKTSQASAKIKDAAAAELKIRGVAV